MAEQRPENGFDELMNRPFNALSDKDMDILRKEVRRLAQMLRSRVALRQKRAKTGQLDAKATIRANLKHNSVPIELKHRDRTLKPKLVVICDISTSMRPASELMLSLLYALQDQISKTHAFAFIDRLEYISPDFSGKEARKRSAMYCCACRPATTTRPWGIVSTSSRTSTWTRWTAARRSSSWAMGAITTTTRGWTCSAASPGAPGRRSGSTRSRRDVDHRRQRHAEVRAALQHDLPGQHAGRAGRGGGQAARAAIECHGLTLRLFRSGAAFLRSRPNVASCPATKQGGFMRITFLGAAREVTGSMHLIEVNGQRVLLEGGLHQGRRDESYQRNLNFPFDPKTIDAVVLSHAHIDHSGNLPNLVKQGFTGNIWCTAATRNLAVYMLQDSGHIQESDIEYLNKKRRKQGRAALEPLYTKADAQRSLGSFIGVGLHRPVNVADGVTVTFYNAGHILGSTFVALDIREFATGKQWRLIFSGDVGRNEMAILNDPELPDA
jgi:glyoxylase-like metal-dependent hydrolase (beta-lactamase superfamily II)